jgi:hypothetical protein
MISVEMDWDEEAVVIGHEGVSTRLRPLEAWLVLYLLDPDWEGFSEFGRASCEAALADNPPVGMMATNTEVLLALPHGHVAFPASLKAEFASRLAKTLSEYASRPIVGD